MQEQRKNLAWIHHTPVANACSVSAYGVAFQPFIPDCCHILPECLVLVSAKQLAELVRVRTCQVCKQQMWEKEGSSLHTWLRSLGVSHRDLQLEGFCQAIGMVELSQEVPVAVPWILPQFPIDAICPSSSDCAPSKTAKCAICWQRVADNWPCAHKLRSFVTKPLLFMPFGKALPRVFSTSSCHPLILLAAGKSSMAVSYLCTSRPLCFKFFIIYVYVFLA